MFSLNYVSYIDYLFDKLKYNFKIKFTMDWTLKHLLINME